MALAFALACLCCAVGNEILVKFFSRKTRSRGGFVAVVGMTWFVLSWALSRALDEGTMGLDGAATWRWGLISGFFSVVSNIFVIEAMGRQSAGLCSTIFRLNLVPAVVGAWLWLGESLSPAQWLGIALAVAAMAAFWPTGADHADGDARTARLGFGLAVASSLLRAGMGLTYKYGLEQGADASGIVLLNALCWIVGGILYTLLRERKFFSVDKKVWRYGMGSGALCLGITFTMAQGLRYGNASVVLPVAQMSFLGTFLLGVWLLGERFTARKGLGLLCGIGCILLVALG